MTHNSLKNKLKCLIVQLTVFDDKSFYLLSLQILCHNEILFNNLCLFEGNRLLTKVEAVVSKRNESRHCNNFVLLANFKESLHGHLSVVIDFPFCNFVSFGLSVKHLLF